MNNNNTTTNNNNNNNSTIINHNNNNNTNHSSRKATVHDVSQILIEDCQKVSVIYIGHNYLFQFLLFIFFFKLLLVNDRM